MFHGRIPIVDKNDDLVAADPTTAAVGEKTNDANDLPCPPKKKKRGQVLKAKRQKAPP